MLVEFADALAEADAVAVANIWASRDLDTSVTSPEALAAAVRARRPGMTAMAPGQRRGDGRLARSERARGRRRPRDGRRAELPDRRAAAGGARAGSVTSRFPSGPEQAYCRLTITAAPVWAACRAGPGGDTTMSGEVSFDVVSEFDAQELRNALDQVRRETIAAVRLPGRDGRPPAGQGRAGPRHGRRVPCDRGEGPHPVQGGPSGPVAQGVRLGDGRACGRQQGPPEDRAAAGACPTSSRRRSPS